MSFLVLEKHGSVTAQDLPEPGRRKFGIPKGGVFTDHESRYLNSLIGNDGGHRVLEIALAHLKLLANRATEIAWGGCHANVRLDGNRVPERTSQGMLPGQILEIDYPVHGARLWLAAADGFDHASGEIIQIGQLLNLQPWRPNHNFSEDVFYFPLIDKNLTATRVISNLVTKRHLSLTVDKNSDRRGVRLTGSAVTHNIELPSSPTSVGAIQLTPDGTLIIIGPDGPTIGGYPQIGWLDEMNLAKVAQLRPGDKMTLTFEGGPTS